MPRTRHAARGALLSLLLLTLSLPALAQGGDDIASLKQRAADLMQQTKYTEALPLLEKIAAAEPSDAQTQFFLGFALIGQAKNTKDAAAARAMRARARAAFVRAKELGVTEPVLDALIQGMAPDGSEGAAFSANAEADRLMNEAEAFFSQGKFDDALGSYQKALRLDPKLYMAALFSGDVYKEKGDFQQAEVWYQKAIEIDPYRETAYRYSATPLMRQKKFDQARDRYVEAYIVEPYNKFSVAGLTQWAEATQTRLAHPDINIPADVKFDEKGDAQINLDFGAVLSGKNDGSSAAWIAYGGARTLWRKEKFAKTYPRERAYRHSLAEEADALRVALAAASADKKAKTLSPTLARLKKLDDEGLLEAYILLARPDQGIAEDHPAYLRQNRDKLRRYVVEYVLTGGGK